MKPLKKGVMMNKKWFTTPNIILLARLEAAK